MLTSTLLDVMFDLLENLVFLFMRDTSIHMDIRTYCRKISTEVSKKYSGCINTAMFIILFKVSLFLLDECIAIIIKPAFQKEVVDFGNRYSIICLYLLVCTCQSI